MISRYSISRIVPAFTIFFMLFMVFSNRNFSQLYGGAMTDDAAIKGYDPVAYFTAGRAMKGNESFSFRWHDADWYFSSKENRDLFASAPAKYAPQYDGYCAWAMTESRKAITDPEVWKIVNGRLYLNCSKAAFQKWSADIPGNIKKADSNWERLSRSIELSARAHRARSRNVPSIAHAVSSCCFDTIQ